MYGYICIRKWSVLATKNSPTETNSFVYVICLLHLCQTYTLYYSVFIWKGQWDLSVELKNMTLFLEFSLTLEWI